MHMYSTAYPPPLMQFRSLSTSSAPSIATSNYDQRNLKRRENEGVWLPGGVSLDSLAPSHDQLLAVELEMK